MKNKLSRLLSNMFQKSDHPPRNELFWTQFVETLVRQPEQVDAAMQRYLSEPGRCDVAYRLMGPLIDRMTNAYDSVGDPRFIDTFERLEEQGVHMLPVDHRSPILDTRNMPNDDQRQRFDRKQALKMNLKGQLQLLRRLSAWQEELKEVPSNVWEWTGLTTGDAMVYYALIRHFKPKRIIELTDAATAHAAVAAAQRNQSTNVQTHLPKNEKSNYETLFPNGPLNSTHNIVYSNLLDISPSDLKHLGDGDILFIKYSHIVKIGSFTNKIILDILPSLARGVIVHFHAIFIPWDFPSNWTKQYKVFWNEQYLLLAFLMNNDTYKIIHSSYYLESEYVQYLNRMFPDSEQIGGTSFWIQRCPSR